MSKDPNFEVKYFADAPAAIVAIFDNREALITMCPTAQLGGSPAIWSSNQSFVAVAENFFEDKWKGTTYANNPLNNAVLLNQK